MPVWKQDRITLEVCVARLADATAAVAGGADRLELNTALELGGLTPSAGLLAEVRQAVAVPVMAMVRPRPAGFVYDESELQTMYAEATWLVQHGADGIVFGVLQPDGTIHRQACQRLVEIAAGRDTVFHRAFDLVPESLAAAQQLVELGITRILTSGQARSAGAGAACIAHLQQAWGHSIELLPGCGITPGNVRQLLQSTGCRQLHGSFSRCRLNDAGVVGMSQYRYTDEQTVRAVRLTIDRAE